MIALDEAREYLAQLDLSYIVEFMCASHYPLPRWTQSEAEQCCQLYKKFLWLNKKNLPRALVPTREIDEFWHNHILYTQRYTQDCMKIFGHYFHHQPESPTDNPETLVKLFVETKALYLEEFGESLGLIKSLS